MITVKPAATFCEVHIIPLAQRSRLVFGKSYKLGQRTCSKHCIFFEVIELTLDFVPHNRENARHICKHYCRQEISILKHTVKELQILGKLISADFLPNKHIVLIYDDDKLLSCRLINRTNHIGQSLSVSNLNHRKCITQLCGYCFSKKLNRAVTGFFIVKHSVHINHNNIAFVKILLE